MRRYPPLVPPWARATAICGLALVLTVWAWWPMFVSYPGTAIEDGHMFHFYIASSKAAIMRYHELPLWNPFDCKGIPLWDYPENITASPIMWLTAALTATQTMIAWNVFHVAAGFVGMWLLARGEMKLGRAASLVAACFWAFSVGHTTQYAGEHEALISFLDAPILLLLWRRAEQSWSYVVGTALAFGWMVYDGATYGLPHIALLLGIETLTRAWPPRRLARVLGRAAVVGVVAFLVGASRLLPILDQFAAHKRPALYPDVDSLAHLASLRDMYMLRSAAWRAHFPPQQYVFGEYLVYVGWLGMLLCVLGLVASVMDARWRWLLFVGGVLVVLMLGHFAKWAPWSLLHEHVFPFKQMRVPSRFRLLLMVPMALWIALATERVPRWFRGQPSWAHAVRVAMLGAALLGAGDMVGLGQELIRVRFTDAPEQSPPPSAHLYYGGAGLAPDWINHPRQNRAWLGCRSYEWSFKTDAPLWEGDVPQARAADDAATVGDVKRTTSTFTIDVDARRPARILLNSAFDQGWRSDVGDVVEVSHELAVDVPPGHHVLHVRYWPRRLTLGLWLSAVGLFGSLLFLLRGPLHAEWLALRERRRAVKT